MKVKVRKRRPALVATEQAKEKAVTHEPQNQVAINNCETICVDVSLRRILKNAMRTT